MRHYSELINLMNTGALVRPKFSSKHKIQYANIEAAFDIETTSTITDTETETKTAHMYVWMVGIGYDESQPNPVYYGNTFEEFYHLCTYLSDYYKLNDKRYFIFYCHNLSYEFQFIKDYFDWTENQLHLDERKPLAVTTTLGIQFRDSLALSGMSLANTARNLTQHSVRKAEGDLDYGLIRNPNTPLTEEEKGYCINDIHIVLAYIKEQIAYEGNITKLPVTKTGRVRKYVRNLCYYKNLDGSNKTQNQRRDYQRLMSRLTMSPTVYEIAKRAFMGGFTHANATHVNRTLNNVTSVDFSSSYPSVMTSEKFPMSAFRPVKPKSRDEFEQYLTTHACLFDIEFRNVRPRFTHENYLSESKCSYLENATINNGRVDSADILRTTLTEVDFQIMRQAYEWDTYGVANLHIADKDYLPQPILEAIMKLYQDKTELKGVEGKLVEYNLSKEMLNSVYGMCVTDPIKPDHKFADGRWTVEQPDLLEKLTKHNESKNRFLYYPWGVWTTAYARRNLWTGIIAVGEDYVYSDTDSLKLFNYEKHINYFNKFNEQILNKIEHMCKIHKIDTSLIRPKTVDGIEKPLGVWEYEGTYERFKTLGAKRYAQQEGDRFSITVAGLGKANGAEYLMELADQNLAEVFNHFSHGLFIPSNRTGKMTHTYIDEPLTYLSTDYLGNTQEIHSRSSVHLEDVSFELTLSSDFITYLGEHNVIVDAVLGRQNIGVHITYD